MFNQVLSFLLSNYGLVNVDVQCFSYLVMKDYLCLVSVQTLSNFYLVPRRNHGLTTSPTCMARTTLNFLLGLKLNNRWFWKQDNQGLALMFVLESKEQVQPWTKTCFSKIYRNINMALLPPSPSLYLARFNFCSMYCPQLLEIFKNPHVYNLSFNISFSVVSFSSHTENALFIVIIDIRIGTLEACMLSMTRENWNYMTTSHLLL